MAEADEDGVYTRNCTLGGYQTYLPTEDPNGLITEAFSCRDAVPEGVHTWGNL